MDPSKLEKTIKYTPAVALLGARQVGKTTLSRYIATKCQSIYLDLGNEADLLKLSEPTSFFLQNNHKLIILDEIQRAPNLFMILRGIIDQNRRDGRRGENFLILGSASMELLKQSSESLAGRISYIEIGGFNVLEILANNPLNIQKLWMRGGFPDSYLADLTELSIAWLENLIRTYLERDIPQMGFKIPAIRLRRLWTMLAHSQGETINFSKLASNLEVDSKTVAHYIDILVDLLLIRKLQPWHINAKKRLVKSPRYYIRDSGIVHKLLGINNYDSLISHPIFGKSWEGFVIENILSVIPSWLETYFYRTAAGAEIDLLLKISNSELWAIEIKFGLAPKIKAGFHQACEDLKATKKYIIYSGNDEFPIANNTTVISLVNFMLLLQKLTME